MRKIFDAVATVGEYTNRAGEKKKRYQNVGAIFEDDEGRMSMKLEALPVSPAWSGWISFYEPKAPAGAPAGSERQPTSKPAAAPKHDPLDNEEDDIPF
jgi:hypothetical protein